jgi:hypothetical protein
MSSVVQLRLILSFPGYRSRYSDWLRAGWLSGRNSSPGRVKNFDFSISSRPNVGPTRPPVEYVPGVKRQGREADHSPSTNVVVKKTWIYTFTPPYVFIAYCLVTSTETPLRISVDGWGAMLQAARRRFESLRGNYFFQFTVRNPSSRSVALGLTQPLTNEYRKLKRGRCVGWQPNRHLWVDCLENVGSSRSHSPIGLHGLLQW